MKVYALSFINANLATSHPGRNDKETGEIKWPLIPLMGKFEFPSRPMHCARTLSNDDPAPSLWSQAHHEGWVELQTAEINLTPRSNKSPLSRCPAYWLISSTTSPSFSTTVDKHCQVSPFLNFPSHHQASVSKTTVSCTIHCLALVSRLCLFSKLALL